MTKMRIKNVDIEIEMERERTEDDFNISDIRDGWKNAGIGWVNAAREFPKCYGRYLVVTTGIIPSIQIMHFNCVKWDTPVTHWMELPGLPCEI